jgi:hypothetical protein
MKFPLKFGLISFAITLLSIVFVSQITYTQSAKILEKQALQKLYHDLQREKNVLINQLGGCPKIGNITTNVDMHS